MHRPTVPPRRLLLLLAFAVLTSALQSRESSAATYYIKADGTGDAPTIAAGLALATFNDVVLVAAGTYFEHDVEMKPGVILTSESGRDFTTIDAQGLGSCVIGANNSELRGFTLTHAGGLNKPAVYCYQASPNIVANRFVNNNERCLYLYQSTADVRDNEFETYAPAVSVVLAVYLSGARIHNNVIHGIIPNYSTSAIELSGVGPGSTGGTVFQGNTIYGRVSISSLSGILPTMFVQNVCVTEHEAFNIAGGPGPLVIQENTLIGGIASLFVQSNSMVTVHSNIIANAQRGIESFGSNTITSDCNDFFNVGTPYSGGAAGGPNDFFVDPLFCNFAAGDYQLQADSPCAEGRSPDSCGNVGALRVGCATVPVRRSSWGAVKELYRR